MVTRYSNGVLDPPWFRPGRVAEGVVNARTKVYAVRVGVVAADAIGTKYVLARVQSSARLLSGAIYHPAVAGVSFTFGDAKDEDGLLAAASFNVAGSKAIGATAAVCGKMLWQVLGYDEDPGGELELYLKSAGAAIAADAEIAAELYFATP